MDLKEQGRAYGRAQKEDKEEGRWCYYIESFKIKENEDENFITDKLSCLVELTIKCRLQRYCLSFQQ